MCENQTSIALYTKSLGGMFINEDVDIPKFVYLT